MVKKFEGVINGNKRNQLNIVYSYLSYVNINSYGINHVNMKGSEFDWEWRGLGLINTSLVTHKGLN